MKRKNILAFCLGLTACIPFRIMGTFYAIEIIALLALPFIYNKKIFTIPQMRFFIILGLGWLIGAICSDYINDTPSIDSYKGWFNIIFFLSIIPFGYWMLKDNPQRWLWYCCGQAFSSLFAFYYLKSIDLTEFDFAIWEIYAWQPFLIAFTSILYYNNYKRLSYLIFLGWGIYSLYSGSRNIFLTASVSIYILYAIDRHKSHSIFHRINKHRKTAFRIIGAVIIAGLIVNITYEYLASTGKLGEHAYDKYIAQKIESGGNVLKGGRGEVFDCIDLISRNPLIGYGSYPMANRHDLIQRYEIVDITRTLNPFKQLPGHSHIFGMWMWHGILGLLFWAYYIYIIWMTFRNGTFIYEEKTIALCVTTMSCTIWNIIFSPMGERMPLILFIIYLMIVCEKYKVITHKATVN